MIQRANDGGANAITEVNNGGEVAFGPLPWHRGIGTGYDAVKKGNGAEDDDSNDNDDDEDDQDDEVDTKDY